MAWPKNSLNGSNFSKGGAMLHPFSLLVVLCFLTLQGFSRAEEKRFTFTHPSMGTVFQIILYAGEEAMAQKAADAAFQRIDQINQRASDYLPESELSRCNRAPAHKPFPLSDELFSLISKAQEVSRQTDGAFDITATYAIQQWRRAKRKQRLPSAEETARAIAMTGWKFLMLDDKARTLTKARDGLQLDLGGIGKGYAADAALRVLREHGITRALVAGSGDLAIGDAPPDKAGWDVALRTFEKSQDRDRLVHVSLKNCGCSTSGDLHQYLELDGKRYSHIIDPGTGLGLTRRIACTVIASDATTSDAMATALCVLGMDAGLKKVEDIKSLQVRFTLLENDVPEISSSPGFPELRE